MDLDELLRIHGNIVEWMGSEIGFAYEQFDPAELKALTPFITDPALTIKMLVPGYGLPPDASDFAGRVSLLSIYSQCNIADLLRMPVSSEEELREFIRKGDKRYAAFREFNLPFDIDARGDALVSTFGSLYDKIVQLGEPYRDVVDSKDVFKLFSELDATFKLSKESRMAYSFALLVSNDDLKNALSLSVLAGEVAPSKLQAQSHIRLLYRFLKQSCREKKKAVSKSSSYEQRLASVEGTLTRKQQELSVANGRVDELQAKIEELEDLKTQPVPPEVQILIDEKNVFESLAHEYERKNSFLSQKLEKERQKRKYLQRKHASVEESSAEVSFSGLQVYASADFRERYLNVLLNYNHPDGEFSDFIDQGIEKICQRIKENGRGAERSEFDFAHQGERVHIYKKCDVKDMRIVLETDWKSWVRIFDVTTPDEHSSMVQSGSGRYKAIFSGSVGYDKSGSDDIELRSSVKELVDSDS